MENIFALLPDALNSSSAYLRCTGHRAACVMSWNWILHGRVHRCYNSLSEHRNSRWVFLCLFLFLGGKGTTSTDKTKPSGLVGALLLTAFPLDPDHYVYCQLAPHMAHGTWLHYVILIKSRLLVMRLELESTDLCLPFSVLGHCHYQRAASTESNGY